MRTPWVCFPASAPFRYHQQLVKVGYFGSLAHFRCPFSLSMSVLPPYSNSTDPYIYSAAVLGEMATTVMCNWVEIAIWKKSETAVSGSPFVRAVLLFSPAKSNIEQHHQIRGQCFLLLVPLCCLQAQSFLISDLLPNESYGSCWCQLWCTKNYQVLYFTFVYTCVLWLYVYTFAIHFCAYIR
jgi:hypothetical protein